nr:FecR family protein [Sphingobacterium faecale]
MHSQNHSDDLPPGTYSALLTLADGRSIDLKDIDGGIRIGGDISYDDGEIITTATTGDLKLTVPRGGTYQLTLEDGTQVWLNSDSELIYPAHFGTNNRNVELRGEAYFKVSKDQKRPFYVGSSDQQIRVIGTEFNVNSYPENVDAVTTLVEGKVQIVDTKTNQNKTLVPGEQSIVGESRIEVNRVDVAPVISWKKGQFNFENKNLKIIMDEFARWYNIEVQYQGVIPSVNLYGDINRDVNLSFALQVLESAGIRYKLKGRVLTIVGSNK